MLNPILSRIGLIVKSNTVQNRVNCLSFCSLAELNEEDVLEFQYEVGAKPKKISMVQQFFADIEESAAVPVHQNGDIPGSRKNRPCSIEAGLVAVTAAATAAFGEPLQVSPLRVLSLRNRTRAPGSFCQQR